MPGRFTDVRRFVDDIAGVDDDLESTEEFSDGEIDIWEEQNLERMCALNDRVTAANLLLGTLHSAVPPRPEGFEISEALEVEDVLKIVERCRRRAQVSRPTPKSSTLEAEVGGRSFKAALDELPGLDDLCMFGVSCRVRRSVFFMVIQDSCFAERERTRSRLATLE